MLVCGKVLQILDDQLFDSPIFHSYHGLASRHFISISDKPCCYFLRADARYVSSISTSPHQKEIFGAAVAIVWIATGLCSAIGVLVFFHSFSIKLNRGLYILYLSFFLFCLLIILVSYSSIAVKIACGNQWHHDGIASRERKLTKTLFIVTVASLTLTQPVIIFWILYTVSSHTFTVITHPTWLRLHYCFSSLFFANSLINPICYGFRIPEFRRALFSCLRCRFLPQPAQVFPLNN